MTDEIYMQRCLELAALGFGYTAPNPMVGCVIVCDNQIIGEGYHQKPGEPHAEVNAIKSVTNNKLLKDSTLYVNLEPCAHYGKTPPCAHLIVEHKIPKVVIGNVDPHALVAGKGIEILREGKCEVKQHVLDQKCRELNRRFFCFHEKKRPYIILKWAQTIDGFIDKLRQPDEEPHPNWITGETARMLVHKWRSEEQSIMIGTKTALLDNPRLNVRDWTGKNPSRILIDRIGRVGDHNHILNDEVQTYIFTEKKVNSKLRTQFINVDFNENLLEQVLHFLYVQDIQSVFVEGGAALINSFIENDIWDEARVFIGKKEFKSGVKAPLLPNQPNQRIEINQDLLFTYVKH